MVAHPVEYLAYFGASNTPVLTPGKTEESIIDRTVYSVTIFGHLKRIQRTSPTFLFLETLRLGTDKRIVFFRMKMPSQQLQSPVKRHGAPNLDPRSPFLASFQRLMLGRGRERSLLPSLCFPLAPWLCEDHAGQ
jgi:hypothetical protein